MNNHHALHSTSPAVCNLHPAKILASLTASYHSDLKLIERIATNGQPAEAGKVKNDDDDDDFNCSV